MGVGRGVAGARVWLSSSTSIQENLALEEHLFRKLDFTDYDGLLVWRNRPAIVFGRFQENLALEEHLFLKLDFTDYDGLLVWRNRPAIVFGRFQNPYRECGVEAARRSGVELVRRWSGGGTVYHDMDNINFSIFTTQQRHDRLANMRLLSETLKDNWGIQTLVSKRHDLLLHPQHGKLSGTAARITGGKAYHHFTLLVNANRPLMSSLLKPSLTGIKTSASKSVPSPVGSLADVGRVDIVPEAVVGAFVAAFSALYSSVDSEDVHPDRPPTFADIRTHLATLLSWQWTFGATPEFSLPLRLDSGLSAIITVRNGRFNALEVDGENRPLPPNLQDAKFDLDKLAAFQKDIQ